MPLKSSNPKFDSVNHTPLITDAQTVTALGADLQTLWKNILRGFTAIKPVKRFPTDNYNTKIAACIEDLQPSPHRSRIHPLLDRLFLKMAPVPSDAILITATAKAGIDNLEKLRRQESRGVDDILPSSLIDVVSEKLGLTGKGFNISAACASSTIAIARGAEMIASGRADAVLVCCLDLVAEFTLSGFSALKALSPGPCQPFDRDRQGLSLGEGAAALLLMSRKRAQQDGRLPLGRILGWGVANDATHITAPAQSGCGLVQAISRALRVAGIKADEICGISAHGTGTIYNDLMELTAFQQVFGRRKVPVYSVKGAIGHTFGAAGGIEVALGLKCLATRTAPPTVGLSRPMDEAVDRVSAGAAAISEGFLLTTNSGFGGINAALVLGR
ncbi:MAG: beta-ketoacyl-[acyl-carrier-protein] synthase family protein [Desulfobacterales bacterium]|nr:beta-ketoacyl-[acyl-carrier-protein] synthase family protein [Desulfobacterales bacterium]